MRRRGRSSSASPAASAAASRRSPTRSRAAGIDVTDTDALAHALTAPGDAGIRRGARGVRRRSSAAPTGRSTARALRRRVFADAAARARLEAILHPLIRAAARREIAALDEPLRPARRPAAARARRHRRRRSGAGRRLPGRRAGPPRRGAERPCAEAEVRAIMATQLPARDRLARADDVLDNAGPPCGDRAAGRRRSTAATGRWPRRARQSMTRSRAERARTLRLRRDLRQNAGSM